MINKSLILTIGACVGTVVTAFLANKAGKKANDILQEKKPATVKEKVKAVWKIYIPTGLAVAATITCIAVSHKLSMDKIVQLTTTCSAIQSQFDRYKNTNIKLNGEGAHSEIVEDICKDEPMVSPDREKIYRFKESITGEFFESTMKDVYDIFYQCNRQFVGLQYCHFDEYVRALGIRTDDAWSDIGWYAYTGEAYYGYTWIDFVLKERYDEQGQCFEIVYPFPPHLDEEPTY